MIARCNAFFLWSLSLFVACRIVTLAAVLLHSLFGCALHHGAACRSHSHADDGSEAGQVGGFHRFGDCGNPHVHGSHRHDGSDGHRESTGSDAPDVADGVEPATASLSAVCLACPVAPCSGRSTGCHSEASCSFLRSSGFGAEWSEPLVVVAFELPVPRVGTTFGRVNQASCLSSDFRSRGSLISCATLCTWLI